jgi:hypothetical protein
MQCNANKYNASKYKKGKCKISGCRMFKLLGACGGSVGVPNYRRAKRTLNVNVVALCTFVFAQSACKTTVVLDEPMW